MDLERGFHAILQALKDEYDLMNLNESPNLQKDVHISIDDNSIIVISDDDEDKDDCLEPNIESPIITNVSTTPITLNTHKKTVPKTNRKNSKYSHIISPVSVYINSTAKTPLMSVIKTSSNLKTIRQLGYETKNTPSRTSCEPSTSKKIFSDLPKKAYISSKHKYVLDKRSPVSIPGGEKIHRYLHSIKEQTVIRHKGKIEMNTISGYRSEEKSDDINKNSDSSLADLSVTSGDVSVHYLEDAKILKINKIKH